MKFYKIVLVIGLSALSTFLKASENTLNIYTWSGYLSDPIIKQFEQETGIRIHHSTYINNEILYAKLKASQDPGYDIIMPSYFIGRMVKQGLLQKIDRSKITNLKNLNPQFLNKEHDPKNAYSIPYLWNATGIVVNKKYHDIQKIKTWNDLWNPRFKDQLLILDDTREAFSIALIALGLSVNETDPAHIFEAFEKLKALMSNIKLFNLDAQRSIYFDEDITVGMGLNGDIYLAKQENPNLEFIYPIEGFVVTLDSVAIPKSAKNIENAHRFIDFILRASIAKQISIESGFSTPNRAALALLPEEMQRDTILYPDPTVMKHARFMTDVGGEAPSYEKYFERLKLEE